MTSLREGELVRVTGERGERDGIVFQVASRSKVVVAVPDSARGAVMRTFHPKSLAERSATGEHDEALRRLVRRSQTIGRGDPGRSTGPGAGARGGHSRPPAHRPTGR